MRMMTVLCLLAAAGSGVALYRIKDATTDMQAEIAAVGQQIQAQRARIALDRAAVDQATMDQALDDQGDLAPHGPLSNLAPITPGQVVSLDRLGSVLPPVDSGGPSSSDAPVLMSQRRETDDGEPAVQDASPLPGGAPAATGPLLPVPQKALPGGSQAVAAAAPHRTAVLHARLAGLARHPDDARSGSTASHVEMAAAAPARAPAPAPAPAPTPAAAQPGPATSSVLGMARTIVLPAPVPVDVTAYAAIR